MRVKLVVNAFLPNRVDHTKVLVFENHLIYTSGSPSYEGGAFCAMAADDTKYSSAVALSPIR